MQYNSTTDDNCMLKCTGNSNEYCGGSLYFGVYSTGKVLLTMISVNAEKLSMKTAFENCLKNWFAILALVRTRHSVPQSKMGFLGVRVWITMKAEIVNTVRNCM